MHVISSPTLLRRMVRKRIIAPLLSVGIHACHATVLIRLFYIEVYLLILSTQTIRLELPAASMARRTRDYKRRPRPYCLAMFQMPKAE